MPTGLDIPIRPNHAGGIRASTGSANDRKIVKLAMASGDNENAFQQGLGIGDGMIFDAADPAGRAAILTNVRAVFEEFERQNRYRLVEDSIRWIGPEDGAEEGQYVLSYDFISLESDDPITFSQGFSAAEGQ